MVSLKSTISKDQLFDLGIKIGHVIGNMHRAIKIEDGKIYFPIQSQSEIELFQRLLSKLINYIELESGNIIFEPDSGYDIHEH
jgi:urease accessory protein